MSELSVGEIPIFVIAGMKCRFAEFGFVIGYVRGYLVLFEQCLLLAIELGFGGEVGTKFTGQRRLDVDFFLGVEERGDLVELLLADGVVLVVVAPGAGDRKAKENGRGGVDSVERVFGLELLVLYKKFNQGSP